MGLAFKNGRHCHISVWLADNPCGCGGLARLADFDSGQSGGYLRSCLHLEERLGADGVFHRGHEDSLGLGNNLIDEDS